MPSPLKGYRGHLVYKRKRGSKKRGVHIRGKRHQLWSRKIDAKRKAKHRFGHSRAKQHYTDKRVF